MAAGRVVVTGASGLLGRALVPRLRAQGWEVIAQYHAQVGTAEPGIEWIQADFSTSAGLAEFCQRLENQVLGLTHCIHLYGPLQPTPSALVWGEDFAWHLHHNLVTVVEITQTLLAQPTLNKVITTGFAEMNRPAFSQVLAYAAAKRALLLWCRSMAQIYTIPRWAMLAPATVRGAQHAHPQGLAVEPDTVAHHFIELLASRRRFVLKTIRPGAGVDS